MLNRHDRLRPRHNVFAALEAATVVSKSPRAHYYCKYDAKEEREQESVGCWGERGGECTGAGLGCVPYTTACATSPVFEKACVVGDAGARALRAGVVPACDGVLATRDVVADAPREGVAGTAAIARGCARAPREKDAGTSGSVPGVPDAFPEAVAASDGADSGDGSALPE